MEYQRYVTIHELNKREVELRIIGEEFIKSNLNKAKLKINNRKFPLFPILPFDEIEEKKDTIKIEIILNKNICNKSYMFKDCNFLLGLSIYEESIAFRNIKQNESIYNEINSDLDFIKEHSNYLNDLSDNQSGYYSEILSIKNKALDDSTLLYYKNTLISSKENYSNLRGMFQNCSSLLFLPDLSI